MSENNLPNRKQIRLKNYDYSRDGYYFITICTHNRQPLFYKPVGADLCVRPNNPEKMIEKWLSEIENKYEQIKICKYVLMHDHIHFIISKTGGHAGPPLQDIIKWFKTMTTNDYIKNVKAGKYMPFKNKIWQRSFYEHVIRDKNDYIKILEYMENNVLKRKIYKSRLQKEGI